MPKITKCTGEGQGSCKRCTDNGKWNRTWMCFLNKIEGYEGCYCNDCTKEIVKECKQEALQERIMSLIPETIDTDAGTHIYLLYQERLKIAKAVTDGLARPFQVYNLQMEEFMDKLTTIDMPLAVLEQIRELKEEVYGKA